MSLGSPDHSNIFTFPPHIEAEMQKLIYFLTLPHEEVRRSILPPLRPITDAQILGHVGERLAEVLKTGGEPHWRPAMASLVELGEYALPGLAAALSDDLAGAVRVRVLESLSAVGHALDHPGRQEAIHLLAAEIWQSVELDDLLLCARAIRAIRGRDAQGKAANLTVKPMPATPEDDCSYLGDSRYAGRDEPPYIVGELRTKLLRYAERLAHADDKRRLAAITQLRLQADPDNVHYITGHLAGVVERGEEPSWRQAMASLTDLAEHGYESLVEVLMQKVPDPAKLRLLEALSAVSLKAGPLGRTHAESVFANELTLGPPEEILQLSARALVAMRQLDRQEAKHCSRPAVATQALHGPNR
jgi:hypothetical protein